MSFQARCPHCQKFATAPEGAEGKKLRCPHCQEMYLVQQEPEAVKAVIPAATVTSHIVWEYLVEDITEQVLSGNTVGRTAAERKRALSVPIQERLNVLGAEGWELAASMYTAAQSHSLGDQVGFWKLIFKRPRPTS